MSKQISKKIRLTVAKDLAKGVSQRQAAIAAGVSPALVQKWRADAGFSALVKDMRAAYLDHYRQSLVGLIDPAVTGLRDMLTCNCAQAKIKAIQLVLRETGIIEQGETHSETTSDDLHFKPLGKDMEEDAAEAAGGKKCDAPIAEQAPTSDSTPSSA